MPGPGRMRGALGPGHANWAHSSMLCNGAGLRQAQGGHAEAGPVRLQPGASALADDCLLPSGAGAVCQHRQRQQEGQAAHGQLGC